MRWMVALSLAGLAVLVLLAQSLSIMLLMDSKEEEFIEHQLSDQIAHSMALWRQSPDAAFPNTPDMHLYRVEVGKTAANVPANLAALKVGDHEIYENGREFHVAVREEGGARFILAYDVDDHEVRLSSLMLLTVAASLILGLITLYVVYLLAGRLTGRLERLAQRVADDVPGPLVEPGMARELQAVAAALDLARERQALMLERERAFGANLSHEIRTPLTGIRTDAEILASLPDLPETIARRGNRIVASVDRINSLATSLLMLAREMRPGASEEISLKLAIENVWDSVLLAAAKPLTLRLDMPPDCTVVTDPALLDLVLRNLLDNAVRYSESGEVVCALDGHQLKVRDSGPGFPEADLERVFDRFFVGPRGASGVGLALVRHVCVASGWQVNAANAPAGGGEITLDLGLSLQSG